MKKKFTLTYFAQRPKAINMIRTTFHCKLNQFLFFSRYPFLQYEHVISYLQFCPVKNSNPLNDIKR